MTDESRALTEEARAYRACAESVDRARSLLRDDMSCNDRERRYYLDMLKDVVSDLHARERECEEEAAHLEGDDIGNAPSRLDLLVPAGVR